jgi:hypothetical protein
MAYRLECAESEEAKEKERSFMGLGLTSRKNLCIHPEVCARLGQLRVHDLTRRYRWLKRRKERWWMHDVGISQIRPLAKKDEQILDQSTCVIGMKLVVSSD